MSRHHASLSTNWRNSRLEKEALFLRHLAAVHQASPLPVPRVYGYGREGSLEYLCLSRVPGTALRHAPLQGAARVQALAELGRVLARVHRVPQAPLRESGLFPGDRTTDDLVARLTGAFTIAVEALRRAHHAWPSDRAPDAIAARALRTLPRAESVSLVALHSNPGATHTFVDPRTRRFTGLIDFGDAYLSHPAFDLVRWPDQKDRAAVLAGYTAATSVVDEAFLAIWRTLEILAELQALARRPDPLEHWERALGQIQRLLDPRRITAPAVPAAPAVSSLADQR